MGLLFGARDRPQAPAPDRAERQLWGITSANDLIPPRPFQRQGGPPITNDSAMRMSAVWAALRLRSDLISTLPVDVFRRVGGAQVQAIKPPVLVNPGGYAIANGSAGMIEWLHSSQWDLDRAGNAIGVITAVDGLGLPSKIELAPASMCSVIVQKGVVKNYRINGELYDPAVIWHEKQYTVPGLFVGLSPIAYAAWAIGEFLSVQEFAMNWFSQGAVPKARLKNLAKTISPTEAVKVKESWRAAIAANEPFVHGNDWEYEFIQAQSASQDWLDAKKFGITDIARFFGVPADLIDSADTGSTRAITYANINQRNLQFLIMNLGPPIIRREAALTSLTPQPRYVKLNTDALLRLDPADRATTIRAQIDARTLTPTEARELENRPPLTPSQIQEFYDLYGVPMSVPSMPAPTGIAPAIDPPEPPEPPAIGPAPEVPAIEPPK